MNSSIEFLNNSNNKIKCKHIDSDEYDKPLFYKYDLRKRNKRLIYLLDWVSLIIVLVIGGILFLKVPVRGRLFTLDDESISYPKLDELVPMQVLIPIIIFIPLVIMVLISLIIKRDINDFHHSIIGLAQSIALTLLLTGAFKCFIGGLRPNFLEICQPTPESIANGNPPVGYGKIYYDKSICTASESLVNDALSSYPSGHSSISASSLVYLALYLMARLKMFDNRGHLFLYMMVSGCLIGTGLIGISRVADYRHTFLNVLCGWIIGTFIALSCYRLNFSSLFGNDNHKSIHSHWVTYWDHHNSLNNNNNNNNDKLNENNNNNTTNGGGAGAGDLESNCGAEQHQSSN